MQRYLWVKISNLDDGVPKSIHEFSKRLVVCLSQTGQGSRGHAMRSTSCLLHAEAFDEGVEAVYGSWWESTVLGQCRPLEGRQEYTT